MQAEKRDEISIYEYEKQLDDAYKKRLGVYYTPKEVCDFIVRTVDEILKREFGIEDGLGSDDVHIIEPAVGTGAFLISIFDYLNPQTEAEKQRLIARITAFEIDPNACNIAINNVANYLKMSQKDVEKMFINDNTLKYAEKNIFYP